MILLYLRMVSEGSIIIRVVEIQQYRDRVLWISTDHTADFLTRNFIPRCKTIVVFNIKAKKALES